MEIFLITISILAITVAVLYIFMSFLKPEDDIDDFRDNNNFEGDTAQNFKPSTSNDYGGYSSYDDDDGFNWINILVWIVLGGILLFSFWSEFDDDDDYYSGYHRSGYYGSTYYGSSRRYGGSSRLRHSGSSFRGRSYGGGGK